MKPSRDTAIAWAIILWFTWFALLILSGCGDFAPDPGDGESVWESPVYAKGAGWAYECTADLGIDSPVMDFRVNWVEDGFCRVPAKACSWPDSVDVWLESDMRPGFAPTAIGHEITHILLHEADVPYTKHHAITDGCRLGNSRDWR
jgi:hypothetical protein